MGASAAGAYVMPESTRAALRRLQAASIPPLYLPYISPTSPLYLPYISPISPHAPLCAACRRLPLPLTPTPPPAPTPSRSPGPSLQIGSPTPTVVPNLLPLALPVCAALPLHRLQAALTEDDGAYISPISPLHLPYISPVSPLYLPSRRSRRRAVGAPHL